MTSQRQGLAAHRRTLERMELPQQGQSQAVPTPADAASRVTDAQQTTPRPSHQLPTPETGASVERLRALILTAPVGAGHDAAAAALARELRVMGADVDVVDGLALLGIERFVVGGYRFQILHAAWSWRMLYRLTRSPRLIRLGGAILSRFASKRLVDRITKADPDVIVSAYPIVSMALAGLRRRGFLPRPCATLVTDFDPHPAWIHPDLNANLVVGEPGRTGRPISPPVTSPNNANGARERIRAELGIDSDARVVLIVGGAWGVGNLRGAAQIVTSTPSAHAIVVTGRNQHLRQALEQDSSLAAATIIGFTRRMPDLMAASDVLIQNAGGLTCLEAFGADLPVVMFEPLPGHGEDNTLVMARAGLVAFAHDPTSLSAMIGSNFFWQTQAPTLVIRGRQLFDRQSPGAAIMDLTADIATQHDEAPRLAPAVAASRHPQDATVRGQ